MYLPELYPHQKDALSRMHNGCILVGGVGTGKSRTSLAYYVTICKKHGNMPLYIVTTPRKRDNREWEDECNAVGLTKKNIGKTVFIDSWNNIRKYKGIIDSFFIFDEDRVVGNGAWVKTYLHIVKRNRWILLSATPGDTWKDYIPVMIANGYYRNRTEFNQTHVVMNPYVHFPLIDHYVNTKRLEQIRNDICVVMHFDRETVRHEIIVKCNYDIVNYKKVLKDRWDIYENIPIPQASKLCYLLRKVSNSDPSRIVKLNDICKEHNKVIVFYNYDYELDELRAASLSFDIPATEWNGHKHEDILHKEPKWLYFVQYASGSEAWNCIETNCIVFFSQNYSYKVLEQAEGRIDRLNTKYKDLYYYRFMCSSGIDLAINNALRQKKSFNEKIYCKSFEGGSK